MNRELSNQVLKLNNREFAIQKVIGRGASCVVYRAVCPDKTEHLLKEYNPKHIAMSRDKDGFLRLENEDDRAEFEAGLVRFREGHAKQRELRLDSDLKNTTSNIQAIYCANGTEYIDMTCFAGSSYEKVQEQSVYDLLRRMKAVAQVIGNYHRAGLLHLDIKPANIFTLPETCELVMLFDFDSVINKDSITAGDARSYTLSWAAPEQINPMKRRTICEATDIFAVGEMIFYQLMGRHSDTEERRSFASYAFDHKLPIFENVNPKVFLMLEDLLHRTICGSIKGRYQSVRDLITKLDEILKIANPTIPYLKSSLPAAQSFFVGRDAEIKEIHQKLSEDRILFLRGIGGIGKSELAKHYAAEHIDDYDAIVFAPYVSDVNMLLLDDNAIPLYNFTPYPEEKPEEYCARKLRKLRELCDERTLFIVDNLDREDDPDLNKLLDLGCKLLITTRRDFSGFGNAQLYVDKLESTEKIREIFDNYYTAQNEKESACIDEIITILEGHTMAVELVAKQIEAEWATPQEILKKLKHTGIQTIGATDVDVGKDRKLLSNNAYGHIKALFDLSVFNCKKRSTEGFILKLLSLLPHTGIDRRLFAKWVSNNQNEEIADKLVQASSVKGVAIGGILGGFSKKSILNEREISPKVAVNFLVKSGWVRLDQASKYISVHPLIAEIVLDSIEDAAIFEQFIKAYISHLRKRNSSDITSHQNHCEDSRVNMHLLNLIERYNFSAPFFEILLNEIGGNLFTIHQYDLALRACELATQIALKNNPAQSYAVTESRSQAALIKASIGAERRDFTAIREAIDIYLQAIENHKTFDENEYPDNYEEIATLYSYTGMAYEDLDEIENARDMYQKGIEVYTQLSLLNSDDYISLGILYNNLGNTYSGSEALKYYLLAKDNHKKSGALTRHAAITLYHLADVYASNDSGVMNLELAARYAQKVLAFFQDEYSDDLYMIGEAKYMLGKVYSQFNDTTIVQNAYTLLKESEKIFVQFLPPEDHTIVKTIQLISEVAKKLKSASKH